MASTRMITKASTDYQEAIAANDTDRVARIRTWLESAALGESDRDCEWHSDYSPMPRTLRRATRQLPQLTEAA